MKKSSSIVGLLVALGLAVAPACTNKKKTEEAPPADVPAAAGKTTDTPADQAPGSAPGEEKKDEAAGAPTEEKKDEAAAGAPTEEKKDEAAGAPADEKK